MHLPLIRAAISVKAGSSFVTPAVSSNIFSGTRTQTYDKIKTSPDKITHRMSKRLLETLGPYAKALDVAGADAMRTWYDAIEERRRHGRDDELRKTESKDAICMD
ncbi:hypothetical protein TNCV_80071 [Trichonephila clavipes]|nr:hypothetical protein TNCV_80071 [Trichonephila clavipes]